MHHILSRNNILKHKSRVFSQLRSQVICFWGLAADDTDTWAERVCWCVYVPMHVYMSRIHMCVNVTCVCVCVCVCLYLCICKYVFVYVDLRSDVSQDVQVGTTCLFCCLHICHSTNVTRTCTPGLFRERLACIQNMLDSRILTERHVDIHSTSNSPDTYKTHILTDTRG